jgi:hypothetical protein
MNVADSLSARGDEQQPTMISEISANSSLTIASALQLSFMLNIVSTGYRMRNNGT